MSDEQIDIELDTWHKASGMQLDSGLWVNLDEVLKWLHSMEKTFGEFASSQMKEEQAQASYDKGRAVGIGNVRECLAWYHRKFDEERKKRGG